jgi:glycosyltransferase involved in cell wall biosynthesis
MIKIVFMGFPALSGNYSHFKYLRDSLKEYQFYLLALGNVPNVELKDQDYVNLGSHLDRKKNQKELALLFLDFCKKEEVDIVIPMNSGVVASCIPFLKKAKVIQVINTDTPRVYHYITSLLKHSSKIICISQRHQVVLTKLLQKSVLEDKTILIPHGVYPYLEAKVSAHQLHLKIGFLGRIHHAHKGVFKIPEILRRLSIPFCFEIVGEGDDKEWLFEQLKKYNIPFSYKGGVPSDQVNEGIKDWDILLFPSQVEGFGLALIEAMNNGVVPIANLLPGITDMIIEDRESGFLVKNNKVSGYVEILENLDKDRLRLYQLKEKARKRVNEKFNLEDIISQYQEVFEEVLSGPKNHPPKDFKEWTPYKEYKPSIWKRILNRIKI